MIQSDREIPGWFPEINRNHLIKLLAEHHVRTVLEIGSFLGKSTVFFAKRVGTVYFVDPLRATEAMSQDELDEVRDLGLPSNFEHIFWDNVRESGVTNIRRLLPLNATIGPVPPHDVDLLYIDGNHSYEAVRSDIEIYGPYAASIICGDDYGEAPGVTQAVDEMFINPAVQIAGPFWWVVK